MDKKITINREEQVRLIEKKSLKDLQIYSPSNCAKHSHKIRTVKDVFNLPSKTLGEFKRAYGKDWVINYIAMWLIELNDDSNVKTKMSDAQMEFTATRIYESYSLKVTDLTLFFRNIKEGVYGQFYENIGQEKIMGWLAEYYKLRCEYGEMQAQCNHENFSMTKDPIPKELIDKMFEGVGSEKVVHEHEKDGLGKRINRVVAKDLITTIKSESMEFLKDYLIKNDYKSKTYDETIYKMVESEIDLRNEKQ